MPSPTASTFPQLLNPSALAGFEASAPLSSTSSHPSVPPGAAEDQLASTTHSAVGNAILNAASIFLTPSSSVSSRAAINGTKNGQTVSSINRTQRGTVLSSVSSSPSKATSAGTSIPWNTNAVSNAAGPLIHAESNRIPRTASVLSRKPAKINHHRSSRTTGIVTPRCHTSSSRGKLSPTPLSSSYKIDAFGDVNTVNSKASSTPLLSKHRTHKSVREPTTGYPSTEQKTSKTGDEKTSTYTRTVTRTVTVFVPDRGVW